jgi:membrane protein
MSVSTAPPPVSGTAIDPPPKPTPDKVKDLDAREGAVGTGVGVGFRAVARFSHAKASLLAAGTTYYLFLAMFSIIAFAYGLTTALGAEQVAAYVTEAVSEAFPGLLGDEAIDPAQLRAVGQATSIIGAIGLLYGGTGAVVAAVSSLHAIYGAPKDPRNIVIARARALGWLLLLGTLILLSFVATTFTADLSARVFDALGIDWQGPSTLLIVGSTVLTLGVNFAIVYLLIANLGGIRPPRHALVLAAACGAVVIEILKNLMTVLVGFTIDKPQYGAFAAPIGVLLVLFLQTLALYGSAALAAGIADKDVPLEVLEASSIEQAQAAVKDATGQIPGSPRA